MDANEVVRHDKARDSELSSHGSIPSTKEANEVVWHDVTRDSDLSSHGFFGLLLGDDPIAYAPCLTLIKTIFLIETRNPIKENPCKRKQNSTSQHTA